MRLGGGSVGERTLPLDMVSLALTTQLPRAKGRTRQRWNQEWGRIAKEGNIWWLGGDRENWESVMSKNKWWWFCKCSYWWGVGVADDDVQFPWAAVPVTG